KIQLEPAEMIKATKFAGVTNTAHTNSMEFFKYREFMAILDNLNRELITIVDWANNAALLNTNTILATTVITTAQSSGM
ncbi:hypothetical protein C0995_006733, partial [Termitomyces sp. Mi166